jgi:hypothetical protein
MSIHTAATNLAQGVEPRTAGLHPKPFLESDLLGNGTGENQLESDYLDNGTSENHRSVYIITSIRPY